MFLSLMLAMQSVQGLETPRLKRNAVPVPMVIDGERLDPMWAYPDADEGQFLFEAPELVSVLGSFLIEEKIALLKKRVTPDETLSLRDLRELGLKTNFDEALLELKIEVPLNMRSQQMLNVSGRRTSSGAIGPDPWSGYLTLGGSTMLDDSGDSAIQLTLVQAMHSVVFEGSATYASDSEDEWERSYARLVHDDTERLIRYAAGDLSYRIAGYQTYLPMIGISANREFSMESDFLARSAGSNVIELNQPSTVEIYVNGRLVSRRNLPRGRFDVRDLPLKFGLNEITVRVIDNFGRTQTLDLSQPFDSEFLAPGVQEFSYNLGILRDDDESLEAAGSSDLVGSLFHRWGLSPRANIGVNFQATADEYMAGAEYYRVSSRGSLRIEGAISNGAQNEFGGAARMRFRSFERMLWNLPAEFSAELEALSSAFRPVGIPSEPAYTERAELLVSTRPTTDTSFGLGVGRQWGLESGNGHGFLSLFLTHRFTRNLSTNLTFNSGRSPDSEQVLLVGLSWFDDSGSYASNTLYDSAAESLTSSFQKSSLRSYDDVNWGINLTLSPDSKALDAQLEGLSQRGTVRVQTGVDTEDDDGVLVGGATSLVWGKDVLTLAKPISDAFVVLKPGGFPEGGRILVNDQADGAEAEISSSTPVVLSDTGSYQVRSVTLDSTTLPKGYWLLHEHYRAQPGYRSGVFIPLMIEQRINVKGRLATRKGDKLPYLAGEVFDEKGRLVSADFFTNGDGVFSMGALTPGKYRIRLVDSRWRPFDVTVAAGSGTDVDVGSITVEAHQ